MSLLDAVTPDVRRQEILRQAAMRFLRHGDVRQDQLAEFMRLTNEAVLKATEAARDE